MKTVRLKLDPARAVRPSGRVSAARLDATGGAELREQQRTDDAEAAQDAARFAQGVRKRLGLTNWSSRSALTCRWTPSVTGNRASAARLARHAHCCVCWTKRPRWR